MARWLLRPAVAKAFSRKLGLRAQVIERTYKLVAERVPVGFDPSDLDRLRDIEKLHGLRAKAIVRADWIKPVSRRRQGQLTAHLMLTVTGVDQANRALKGLTIGGRQVLVRRDIDEPKRCARCQQYGGHFARECPAAGDTCATCAGPHPTSQCNETDPARFRCANCNEQGHAAWDHNCPTLRAKVRARLAKKADAGFRFFVTNNPETWVSEEDELAQVPPPPTMWSQIRPVFDRAEAATAPTTQRRVDEFFTQAGSLPPPTQ
ncbi:hypothetical protein PYCCODRAFT_1367743 [Trametes coccinea BRFM310]|uniref:CCHC-type domain-containing protein n=1 Tax=Trametes coccinea (strain BRFM310) TaxID=1353009 RepID=A0A1Y2INU2_TRAC3|nr:hypothetical protein PYCCODRAFT_1367743 [Trametes coccinea BRFM310]